jgi:hypothetical protein
VFILFKDPKEVNNIMENQNQSSNTQITVADLDALRSIVDVATQRGAFRGAELTQVGTVFDKLSAFLAEVVAQAKANADAVDNASTETQGE